MGQNSTSESLTGGCQCGEIRFAVHGAPVALYVCHCRECQKQSSSAFGISVRVLSAELVLLSGTPKIWKRRTTIAGSLDCAFCPNCGSRVWHGNADTNDVVSIKGGTLDTPPDLSNAAHIWTSRKLQGVLIPDHVETHLEEPPF